MGRDEYSVDSNRRIRAQDSVFAPDAWNDLPTFKEALSAAGKNWLFRATLGNRKELWVSELRTKYLLDIEEGASLVASLNCRRGITPFKWRDEKFYPIRPD